ncbi:MAG: 23S rRNA (pseudouridine(1915)-N(3))-methyltransferase RlmH [Oscillospiraceae bacterium]|jgi:23S rRNA (pseudouridine1915-N3)-methyltransferase|nr:23S rRNA (pseudouridine(1915)-N(3))-methyltransferase RlmH [Oscillospiraceae bacterium]
MLQIDILAYGRLKEDYLRAACYEYEKRLKSMCKLRIEELTPTYLPENPSAAGIARALQEEALRLRALLPKQSAVIPLCIEGRPVDSEGFAGVLERYAETPGRVAFLIGSSHGLDAALKQEGDMKLSLSPMTFPHQLTRVMLLEQIYRALSIIGGGKYHK